MSRGREIDAVRIACFPHGRRGKPDAIGLCAGLGTCWIGLPQARLGTLKGKVTLELPPSYVQIAPILAGHPKSAPPVRALPQKCTVCESVFMFLLPSVMRGLEFGSPTRGTCVFRIHGPMSGLVGQSLRMVSTHLTTGFILPEPSESSQASTLICSNPLLSYTTA